MTSNAIRQRLGSVVRSDRRLERLWSRATAGRHFDHFAGPGKRLMVEGFPRSGNTFLCALLFAAGLPEDDLAHHFHSLGHVKAGLELGLDVIVVVRSPAAAVASLTVRQPRTDPRESLREYSRFHRGLVALRSEQLSCVTFETLIDTPERVVGAALDKLGATPRADARGPALVSGAFARIEDWHREAADGSIDASTIALPGFAEDHKTTARRRVDDLVARTSVGRAADHAHSAVLTSLHPLVADD